MRRMLVVVAMAVLAGVAGCESSTDASAPNKSRPKRSYALSSNGWKPGDYAMLARGGGVFHAELTSEGACAWLGSGETNYTWPAGYRVRFHPTVLLDPKGRT